MQEVADSSSAVPTIRGYGSVGRAVRSQRTGRRFDPDYLHKITEAQKGASVVLYSRCKKRRGAREER